MGCEECGSYNSDGSVAMRNIARGSGNLLSKNTSSDFDGARLSPAAAAPSANIDQNSTHTSRCGRAAAGDSRGPVRHAFGHLISALCLLMSVAFAHRCRADHLQEIQHRGVLLWGADAEGGAPYVYPNPEKPEQLIGFEYELADALAAKLGVKAKMVQNQWDQLVPALDRGNFDIILNGLEITADNQQHIAMSQPYFVYAQQIVTRKETTG